MQMMWLINLLIWTDSQRRVLRRVLCVKQSSKGVGTCDMDAHPTFFSGQYILQIYGVGGGIYQNQRQGFSSSPKSSLTP